jgi:hypothetical protein
MKVTDIKAADTITFGCYLTSIKKARSGTSTAGPQLFFVLNFFIFYPSRIRFALRAENQAIVKVDFKKSSGTAIGIRHKNKKRPGRVHNDERIL